ncbi:Fur family transcriptional regulator [Pontibacter sp. G13]|uniref:Fur family transcriptional regulator n=1 Tax=Pontibacter sp. G13 TaxID=3074898 RepID=UPI00288A1984|nr:Fur family transcriptional regulator [Pontibacter sp. G13]WNJ20822.1 Fur family transcriptional regulator [Pontibacter sp. G13]
MEDLRQFLKHHALRFTPSRADMLQVLMQHSNAMSQREIESAMKGPCDRVTIYRNLSSFLDKGIIHKVLDNEGVMKYAICSPQCSDGSHHHDHVHFKCLQCGDTTCVDEVKIPAVALPEGYQLQEVNMLLQGLCPKCR